jgi:hypothetical protein
MPVLYSCQTEIAMLNLENIGDAKIIIDSIIIKNEPDVFESSFAESIDFPIEFIPNNKLAIPIKIYAEKNIDADINADIFYNSGGHIRLSEKVIPKIATITSLLIPSQKTLFPGDTLLLLCKSNLTYKSEKLFNYKITLHFNKYIF